MRETYNCPMCGAELRPADYADDVLSCETCGPVVYLGRTRAADAIVETDWEGSVSYGQADRQAFPYLSGILGQILDEAKGDAA